MRFSRIVLCSRGRMLSPQGTVGSPMPLLGQCQPKWGGLRCPSSPLGVYREGQRCVALFASGVFVF